MLLMMLFGLLFVAALSVLAGAGFQVFMVTDADS
jgi:hypothetical protein